MPEPPSLNLHDDLPLFREAINFTASRTGFNARLVERDYFCTVLLAYLAHHGGRQLVFKGGTCLAKVHAGFYRLSEDLDFTIPLPVDASRKMHHHAVAEVKKAVAGVTDYVPAFTATQPLQGANNSTQYNGAVSYHSPTSGQPEAILIEVSVREPLLMPAQARSARTLLLDPIGDQASVPPLTINCIAMIEAMAEKFRAALSRKDVAIRDFYDLDYAVEHLDLDVSDAGLVGLVRQKLAVPGNLPVDTSAERLAALRRQRDARLKTVLRDSEFQAFDLDRAIGLVLAMAQRMA
jgi:predicted nucleotidyltransferase component of viral defense system